MYVLGRDLFISDFYDIVYYKSNIFFSRTDLGGLSRKEIVESVKHSLKNLGTEYIDLVIIHKYDANCPIEGMCLIIFIVFFLYYSKCIFVMYFFHEVEVEVEVDFIFKREMLSQMRSECREGLYLESRKQRRNGIFFSNVFF